MQVVFYFKGFAPFFKLLCLLPYITNPALLLVIKMGMIAGIIGGLGNPTTITFYLLFLFNDDSWFYHFASNNGIQ